MSSLVHGPRRLHRVFTALAAAAALTALAACGSSGAGKGADIAAKGSGSAPPGGVDLSGVTLKVSYQTADFPELLKASGLFDDTPYKYQVPIINGPANQLAALYGKQIDVGEAGDNTGAFEVANAAKPWTRETAPIQGIAVHWTPDAPYPSVTLWATRKSGIKELADLRGKKIGYNYGGNIYAGYVLALANAGLTPEDVHGVQFPANQAAANAFNAGDLDAVVTQYSLVKKKADSGEAAKVVDSAQLDAIAGGGWLAQSGALKDPARLAAIKDFFGRLRTFYEQWVPSHEAEYERIEQRVLNQSPDVAKVNWQNAARTTFYKIGDPEFFRIQQKIVDAAYKFGGLKTDADVKVGYTTELDPVTTG